MPCARPLPGPTIQLNAAWARKRAARWRALCGRRSTATLAGPDRGPRDGSRAPPAQWPPRRGALCSPSAAS
eukprot:5887561-Alexandrium_andersonii.AAC.1